MNRKEYLHFITEAMQIIGFLNRAYYMVHKEKHKNKKRENRIRSSRSLRPSHCPLSLNEQHEYPRRYE